MNSKRAKKLRWYARAQEAMMPAPVVNQKGISSQLLIYHETGFSRTIQYNPRTSGKGFYKALKGKNANIKGSSAFVRYMCQRRIIELLAAKQRGQDGSPPPDGSLGNSLGNSGGDTPQPENAVSRQRLTAGV